MQVTAGTLTPMAVFVENALVLLTRFFCAVARRWDLGDLSKQVKLTVNNFWRPIENSKCCEVYGCAKKRDNLPHLP